MGINLVQTSEIEKFFLQQAEGDLQLASWLNTGLMRSICRRAQSAVELLELPPDAPDWLREKWGSAEGPFHRFQPDPELVNRVRHIVDWLSCARQERAPFLQRRDAQGVPLKIHQLSLESAFNSANKYFERAHSRMAPLEAKAKGWEEPGITRVMELAQGRHIVEIFGPNALRAEGMRMKHCVGSYGFHLMMGTMSFFSLRDADGRPQATFSITAAGALDQCKGPRDKEPLKRDLDEIVAFLDIKKVTIPRVHPDLRGYFQPPGEAIHPFYALPPGYIHTHRFNLYNCDKTVELPPRLIVSGEANIHRCPQLERLGDGMTVLGKLSISDCPSLEHLPEDLMVGGQLRIHFTALRRVPAGLTLTGDLALYDCPFLVSLGRTMTPKNIYITDCPKLVLPKLTMVRNWLSLNALRRPLCMQGVAVEGNLALYNCNTVEDGLRVTGNLYLKDCHGLALPKGLRIGGDLTIVNSPGVVLPEDLVLGGKLTIKDK